MKRIFFVAAALVALITATGCEQIKGGNVIRDVPYIAFEEDQMIVDAEGGEFYIMVNSTGIDNVSLSDDSNWVRDENDDLVPIDEWIEVVKVINEYEAESDGTRALAKWDSAIVIKVTPNDTGYGRNATLSATSFTKSDLIIIRQPAMAEE